jgi:NADH-quinone oxidoreductase subunit E
MFEIASKIVLCLILAAILGFMIGYFLAKYQCSQKTDQITEENETDPDTPEENGRPALLSEPLNGQKDNLTKIKGIGVQIENSLNNIGIFHFYQIAQWDEENLKWVDENLSFPGRALRDDWIGQAKLLDEGEETEFSKRVDNGEVSSSKQS